MIYFTDIHNRKIRLTPERKKHIEEDHPEMRDQFDNIKYTLSQPEVIIRSKTDETVELFFRYYKRTPVSEKYLCVVVKNLDEDLFIITAYFTDSLKRGEVLWKRQ